MAVVVVAAIAATLVSGCERESERYGRELQERLAASGILLEETLAWPPRGSVPHWVVEAHFTGDEAAAEAACEVVAATPMPDGELPYLVRLTYEPAGTVQCGWAAEPGASPDAGASPPG